MLHTVHKKLGFTIVELVVVIIILGLLISIGFVSWNGIQKRAYNLERLNELKGWESIFKLYAAQERKYPPVPSHGGYCLGTGFPDKAYIESYFNATGVSSGDRWSPEETALPSSTGFCRSILSYGPANWHTRHHANGALNTALATVGKLPKNTQSTRRGAWLVGPFVTYSTTRIFLTQSFVGNAGDCPKSTTYNNTDGSGMVLCDIDLPLKAFDIVP